MSSASHLDTAVRAARGGDEAAFRELFREIQPRLLRYLRGVTGDNAEDVAAETWVQVVRGLAGFDGDFAGFRGWVFTIARSRTIDAWRAAGRRHESPTDRLPDTATDVDVAREAEMRHSTAAAVALLRELPESQAQVLMLRVVAGLDVATTATLLGRSPNHVRVLAHRGLKALELKLRERAHEPL